MNDRQLARILKNAGFRGSALKTAFGVAKGESGGRPDAFNPDASTGDRSYGLFQINMLGSLGPARRKQYGLARDEDLFDPVRNAKIAYRMSNGGRDWSPWSAYKNGSYQRHLAAFPERIPGAAVGRALPGARASQPTSEFKLPEFDVIEEATREDGAVPDFSVDRFFEGSGRDWNRPTVDFKISEPPPLTPKQKVVGEVRARAYGGTTVDTTKPGGAPFPKVNTALQIAKQQLGKPYVWGAASPGVGFDCSGLIEYAFEQAGIPTPGRLTTYTMRNVGKRVPSLAAARPGDWLITNGGKHVVMYVGQGKVIAAPRRGEVVQYQPVSRFVGDIVDIRRYP